MFVVLKRSRNNVINAVRYTLTLKEAQEYVKKDIEGLYIYPQTEKIEPYYADVYCGDEKVIHYDIKYINRDYDNLPRYLLIQDDKDKTRVIASADNYHEYSLKEQMLLAIMHQQSAYEHFDKMDIHLNEHTAHASMNGISWSILSIYPPRDLSKGEMIMKDLGYQINQDEEHCISFKKDDEDIIIYIYEEGNSAFTKDGHDHDLKDLPEEVKAAVDTIINEREYKKE